MKMGNGMGSVSKLSGHRRKPWIVRVTDHWEFDKETGKNKQIRKTVGCYATRKEALEALVEFNKNPYDLDANVLTFADVYEKWSVEHFQEIVPSACRTWISAYNHSAPLHNMRMKDVRVNHLEGAIAAANVGATTKQRMKSLYNLMYKYALKHEIVDKNYADLCKRVKDGPRQIIRVPFSDAEIRLLWSSLDIPFVDMVLVGIYSGWRPQELSILKIVDVDLDNWIVTGGLKTDAGKNRLVPIHPLIRDLIKKRYDNAIALNSDYLFTNPDGSGMTYDKYRRRFDKIKAALKLDHRPHDTRHTFITLAKAAGMDEYILKLIVGHEVRDVTEKIYTHRTIEDLQSEILKIKEPQG